MQSQRKKLRLSSWDYSLPGVYFLTFCTNQKRSILSHIVGRGILDAPEVQLTAYGKCVQSALETLIRNDPKWMLHNYVIMPNHVHLLLELRGDQGLLQGASGKPRPTDAAIPKFMSSIKRYTNRVCGVQLWQERYYDHVIRDERDFIQKWKYIDGNPARWIEDTFYVGEEQVQ